MINWIRKHKGILLLAAVFLSLNLIFVFVSPDQIVSHIGVQNTYITIFVIATFGGLNSVTGGVLYVSIVAFAAGGASPWLLGFIGGLGIAIGNFFIFYLFRYTSKTLSDEMQEKVTKVRHKIERLPQPAQYTLIYLYLGFSPFPDDILLFLLAVLRYRLVQVIPLIIIGAITIATLTAFLGENLPFL